MMRVRFFVVGLASVAVVAAACGGDADPIGAPQAAVQEEAPKPAGEIAATSEPAVATEREAGEPAVSAVEAATVEDEAVDAERADAADGEETFPPGPAAASEVVRFSASDGTALVGDLRLGSGVWVLFAHQNGADRGAWGAVPDAFADAGWSTLAWDFRGFGESDDGSRSDIGEDWIAAVEFAASQGATTVWAVGASMGGTAALAALADAERIPEGVAIGGIATISAPGVFSGIDALATVRQIGAPLLLMAGAQDANYAAVADALAAAATAPVVVEIFDTGLHGNSLATSAEFGAEILALLQTWGPQFN